jgi:hypothetical protein
MERLNTPVFPIIKLIRFDANRNEFDSAREANKSSPENGVYTVAHLVICQPWPALSAPVVLDQFPVPSQNVIKRAIRFAAAVLRKNELFLLWHRCRRGRSSSYHYTYDDAGWCNGAGAQSVVASCPTNQHACVGSRVTKCCT